MASRLDTISERVSALLAEPAKGRGAPPRDLIEGTLTEGYAEALALDGERLRLTRKLERLTAKVAAGDASRSEELRSVILQLDVIVNELADLRDLLSALRGRVARAA